MGKDELTAKATKLLGWKGQPEAREIIQGIFDLANDHRLPSLDAWLDLSLHCSKSLSNR